MFCHITGCRYVELLSSLSEEQFVRDIHLDDMLVFAAGTDLHEHYLYTSGHIILQDKVTIVHISDEIKRPYIQVVAT